MVIQDRVKQFSQILDRTIITDGNGNELNHDEAYDLLVDKMETVRKSAHTVYLVGNGGSSAIVSHVAIDLLNANKIKSNAITDASTLTCLANDYGYENMFAQALSTMMVHGDVLIAVSSSGNSMNIRNAAEMAKEQGGMVITLSGFKVDNGLRGLGDINFWIDSASYGTVEVGHMFLLHILTDKLV